MKEGKVAGFKRWEITWLAFIPDIPNSWIFKIFDAPATFGLFWLDCIYCHNFCLSPTGCPDVCHSDLRCFTHPASIPNAYFGGEILSIQVQMSRLDNRILGVRFLKKISVHQRCALYLIV